MLKADEVKLRMDLLRSHAIRYDHSISTRGDFCVAAACYSAEGCNGCRLSCRGAEQLYNRGPRRQRARTR